jgi:hypothetical protein
MFLSTNVLTHFIKADGSVYQTRALSSFMDAGEDVRIEAEYTGNELETVYDMKVMPSDSETGYQRIACAVRDGKIKIY